MPTPIKLVVFTLAAMCGISCSFVRLSGQVVAAAPVPPPAARDLPLEAAEDWVGRALFLRGFPGGDDLEYDRQGHLTVQTKPTDWTLAAMDVSSVSHKSPEILEFTGVRVAIRYNADQHTFERHPMKNEKVRLELAIDNNPKAVNAALTNIFSVGIDVALQRSMPSYWLHYFIPATDWPDALKGQVIVAAATLLPPDVQAPQPEKVREPVYTAEAKQDRVRGTVTLRVVVDTTGRPQRVTVRSPLGYGLDARAAEGILEDHFKPGTKAGTPAAVEMIINQIYE